MSYSTENPRYQSNGGVVQR